MLFFEHSIKPFHRLSKLFGSWYDAIFKQVVPNTVQPFTVQFFNVIRERERLEYRSKYQLSDGDVQGINIINRYRTTEYYDLLTAKIKEAEEQKELAEKAKNKKG